MTLGEIQHLQITPPKYLPVKSEECLPGGVVMACAGDVPTIETCAASWLLQKHLPGVKVRVVNVVDLGTLMNPDSHPHGMDNLAFEEFFKSLGLPTLIDER